MIKIKIYMIINTITSGGTNVWSSAGKILVSSDSTLVSPAVDSVCKVYGLEIFYQKTSLTD